MIGVLLTLVALSGGALLLWAAWLHLRSVARLQLELDQAYCYPGMLLSGVVHLQLLRAVDAGPLRLSLVAEARITEFEAGRRRVERCERYRETLELLPAQSARPPQRSVHPFQLLLPKRLEDEEAPAGEEFGILPRQCARIVWYLEAELTLPGGARSERWPLRLQRQ